LEKQEVEDPNTGLPGREERSGGEKGRAFSYQAPLWWNKLPVNVRGADTLSTFKIRLKTFLFDKAYS